MDEFAMGSSTETSFFGPTANLGINLGFLVDQGGLAAAVSAGLSCISLGTDTYEGQLDSQHLCEAGMKPTYGRISRFGMIAFSSH